MNLWKPSEIHWVKLADKSERYCGTHEEVVNTAEALCRTGPGRSWVTLTNYRSPENGPGEWLLPPLSRPSEERMTAARLRPATGLLFHIRSLVLPCCRNPRHTFQGSYKRDFWNPKWALWKNSKNMCRKNVIHNNNRTKIDHAIILIDANKTFSTNPIPFMIKFSAK